MAQEAKVTSVAPSPADASTEHTGSRLGAFLCWSVVFADIGTSVYYTPGILYSTVGRLAGLFVSLTLIVFILLTLKYAEVSVRFPEGGGVVTVAARGLNPWAGAVGGMFILVDYFLTSAISSLSGLTYFEVVLPRLAPYVLIVTLLVLVLLGVLNWWGIRESATVSAVFAVAAFVSDLVIIVVVLINVPMHTILGVLHVMFSGSHLGPTTLLTGFAGSFLAFSGLESISQLSPVMKTPRSKTVTAALAFVAISVGITSPLLTIFSTTLLDVTRIDPSQFISALAGTYGGPLLAIATAVTASTLLVFASNTAIIGAYHVFLALSRMHFFPGIIERHNKFRGTPHVAIILATAIPMAVLVAVRGDINRLGELYAFGLLGAFSLTSIALDVIRYRERHGSEHIGAIEDPDADDDDDATSGQTGGSWVDWLHEHFGDRLPRFRRAPADAERFSAPSQHDQVADHPHRSRSWFARIWPDARYYLGFLTTFLVVLAWCTNLVSKPAATAFGGSLTLVGVAVAVVTYRREGRAGVGPVFPLRRLPRVPDSILVVLLAGSRHNGDVILAATESAHDRPLVFLYVTSRRPPAPELLQINDPYLTDREAQSTFHLAAVAVAERGLTAYYVYRIGSVDVVADAWRAIRPQEIVAEDTVARQLSRIVPPEYVRYQVSHGLRVAHLIRHHGITATTGAPTGPAEIARSIEEKGTGDHAEVAGTPRGANGPTHAAQPADSAPNGGSADAQRLAGQQSAPPSSASDDSDEWVWTGTDLVRRSDKRDSDTPTGDDDGT